MKNRSFGKKHFRAICFVLLSALPASVHAAGVAPAVSLSGQATYGAYGGSEQRKDIFSESAALVYQPPTGMGASILGRDETLHRKDGLSTVRETDAGLSLFETAGIGRDGYLSVCGSFTRIFSDDRDSDRTNILYGAVSGKLPESSLYLDLGVARSGYASTSARQVTATAGFQLFDPRLYLRTRLFYINLSSPVEGERNSVALEERLYWYLLPGRLTLTLYGLAGRRVHAYDPDTGIPYTQPDIQRGSAGLTALYAVTPALRLYLDETGEAYRNDSIDNRYIGVYSTLGVAYTF